MDDQTRPSTSQETPTPEQKIQDVPIAQHAETAAIVASAEFTKAIAVNPYTQTTKIDNFGKDNVLAIRALLTKRDHHPAPPRLTFRTQPVHLGKLFIQNGAGGSTYTESRATDIIGAPLLELMAAPFAKGAKYSQIGMQANFGGKFIVNPFSKEILEADDLDEMDKMTANIQYMSDENFPTDTKRSVQHLFNAIMATIRFARDAGGYRYVSNRDHVTDYGQAVPRTLGSDVVTHEMTTPGLIVLDTTGPASIGMLRFGVNPGPDLARLTGALPYDDYTEYPLIAFTPYCLPNNNHREYCRNQIRNQLEFGVQSTGVVAAQGYKTSETIIMATDALSAHLNYLSLNDLAQHVVDEDELVSFMESCYPSRDWFDAYVGEYPFYKPQRAVRGVFDQSVNQAYIIASDQAKNAYVIAGLLHPSLLSDVFRTLVTTLQAQLATFPFLSLDGSLTDYTSPSANATHQGLNAAIAALSMSVRTETPEEVAIKAVLSMMAQYVMLKCIPSNFDQTKSPQYFVQDLLGLLVGNLNYRHLHLRNKAARMQTFHDFLSAYFRVPYSAVFDRQGFGTDALGNVVKSISGRDRLTCTVVVWTIDRLAGAGANQGLLHDTCAALSLNNNNFWINDPIPANRYRISARTVLLPGECTGPQLGSTSIIPPIALYLQQRVDDLGGRYFQSQLENNTIATKAQRASYVTLMDGIKRACESYSMWFTTIYCPLYRKIARSPLLTEDDVVMDYNEQIAYRDRVREDIPGYALSVPHHTPTPVLLIGIPDSLFGSTGARTSFGLLLTATCPGAYVQGMSINKRPQVTLDLYRTIYSPIGMQEIIKYYFEQLYRRQLAIEGLELAESVARGNFLDFARDIRDCFRDALRTAKLPAAGMAMLLRAVGYMSQTDQDRELLKFQDGIVSALFNDPRMARPVRTYITFAEPNGVARSDAFRSRIRPYVIDSAHLVIEKAFGANGIKPVKRGITYSKCPLPALSFNSVHPVPAIRVVIDPTKAMTYGENMNSVLTYAVSVYFPGARPRVFSLQSPYELLARIRAIDPTVGLPAYTIQVDNPTRVTQIQAEFAAAAVSQNHAVIQHMGAYSVPYYALMGSAEADQVDIPVRVEDVRAFMSTPVAYTTETSMVDVSFETHGVLTTNITRTMLTTNPNAAVSVMQGFYANVVTPQTFLDPRVAMTPAVTAAGQPPMIVDEGVLQYAINYAPQNQTSAHASFTRPPITSTWIADGLA